MRSLWLIALGLSAACGYRVVGAAPPFGMTRLAVVPFDEAVPLGISPELARALSGELAESGARISTDRAGADGTLSGRVNAASTMKSPTSADPAAVIPAYRLSVQVEAYLVDAAGNERWRAVVALDEDFLAATDNADDAALRTETSRRRAVRRLAERLARELHERLAVAATEAADGSAAN